MLRTLLLSALTASLVAQTTGVPGINDYTINGLGSGATSCVSLCFPNGNVTLNLAVSAPFGSFALLLFNFCPCQTCGLPGPTNACVPPIPLTACGGSNQSLDLDLTAACGPAIIQFVGPSTAGFPFTTLTIPPLPGAPCTVATLSTQAAVINPCGLGVLGVPGPFVMTQSFTVNF
ncbi:MAG: hypothetical protein WAT39_02455 [Planctomycetota bacterium]